MDKMGNANPEPELISTTTILIISTFLVGVAVGRFGDDLSPYILAAGLSGFLAFFALDIASTRRTKKMRNQVRTNVEQRLERHTHSISGSGFRVASSVDPDREYVESRQPASVSS